MGNRATVIFWDASTKACSPAVYLHWNGGPDSVYGFLEELDRRNVRADQEYECARFIQIVGEFFSQSYAPPTDGDPHGIYRESAFGLSLGVVNGPTQAAMKRSVPKALEGVMTDHGDNGFYLVDRTQYATNLLGESVRQTHVRRFVERYVGDGTSYGAGTFVLKEMEPEEVEQEKIDEYRFEFRKFFSELYPQLDPAPEGV